MADEAAVTHNIVLNSEGYIVARETYQQANQTPLVQRVAMGEVDLSSLDNFQYIRDDDFTGGEGLKTFGDPDRDRFDTSYGFYPKDVEELRLLRAVQQSYSASINQCYLKAFAGKLWLADRTAASLKYSTDGVSFSTFTLPTGYSGACGGLAIVHNGDAEERLLVMSVTGIFFGITEAGIVDTTVGTPGTGVKDYSSFGGTWQGLIEWGNAIYMGHDCNVFRRAAMAGDVEYTIYFTTIRFRDKVLQPAYETLMFNSGMSYIPPEDYFDRFPAGQGQVVCMATGLSPQLLCVGSYDSTTGKSFITLANGTSEFATISGDALMYEPAIELPDFEIASMIGFQKNLIYGGRKTIAGRSVGHVYSFPRYLICEVGKDLSDALDYTVRAMAPHEDIVLGLSNNVQSDGKHAPGVMVLTEKGYYKGPQPISFTSASSTIVDAIETFNGKLYWAVRGKGLYRESAAQTFVQAAQMITSRFDGNMKVVDKVWLDLEIRLGRSLASGQTLTAYYQTDAMASDLAAASTPPDDPDPSYPYIIVSGGGAFLGHDTEIVFWDPDADDWAFTTADDDGLYWVSLGSMTSDDAISKTLSFPSTALASWVKIKLVFAQTGDSDVVIEALVLRALVVAGDKLEWAFEIKAENALLLLDSAETGAKSLESRDGLEIMQDLRTVYKTRQPVSFVDIDGVTYTVILSNVTLVNPYIAHPTTDNLEYGVAVELLEV